MLNPSEKTNAFNRQAHVSSGNGSHLSIQLYPLTRILQSYNFFIVNDGIDKHTSMLRPMNSHRRRISTSSALEGRLRRRSSASQSNPPVVTVPETKPSADMEIDELEKSMSALRFVPTSVARNRSKMPGK
jgi:hypothetical protein